MQNNFSAALLLLLTILGIACAQNNHKPTKPTQHHIDTVKYTSSIRAILHDSKGNYWIGSDQEGACKYNGKSYQYFTEKDGLGKQVFSIQEDKQGTIWLSTNKGIFSYNGIKIEKLIENKNKKGTKTPHTEVWLPASESPNIIGIEKGVAYVLKNPLSNDAIKSSNFGITAFAKSQKGGVWIAYYGGVLYYNGQTFSNINDTTLNYHQAKNFNLQNSINSNQQGEYLHIRSILEDSKGRLWIGNNGIGVLLKEKNSILNFSKQYHLFAGTPTTSPALKGTLMHVFAITEDKKGNIWFGDRDNGAWRYDGKTMQNYIVDESHQSQHIWQIYEDRKGNLLFAMAQKGVYLFNGQGFERFF